MSAEAGYATLAGMVGDPIAAEHEPGGGIAMFWKILCTAVALLFAILSFCGLGPMPGVGVRISFGLGFILIAFVIWRSWRFIVGDFSPAIMDTFTRPHVDPGGRSRDDR